MNGGKVTKSIESKQIKEGFPTNIFLVGNYGPKRVVRDKSITPGMSSDLGEICLCLHMFTSIRRNLVYLQLLIAYARLAVFLLMTMVL